MRTFITIGIPRGDGKSAFIAGPDKPREFHVGEFRKFQARPVSDVFSEVQLWESSGGIQKRIRLSEPQARKPSAQEKLKV